MVTVAAMPQGVEILVEGYALEFYGPDVSGVIRFYVPDGDIEGFRRVASRPLQHPSIERPCLSVGEPACVPVAGGWVAEVRFRG